jgi:hypothetical protein
LCARIAIGSGRRDLRYDFDRVRQTRSYDFEKIGRPDVAAGKTPSARDKNMEL